MDTFGFHDKNGRSTFHVLYNSYVDEFEVQHRNLITALPDELIKSSSSEIHKLFQDNNRHLDNNIVEVMQQLGAAIIRHEFASLFYYTGSVLRGKELLESMFYSIVENYSRFQPIRGVIYTPLQYPVEHFILHLKYHRYRLFYPEEFSKEVQNIPLEQIRKNIPPDIASLIIDILCNRNVRYFQTLTEVGDVAIFALEGEEILFFVALSPILF